MSAPAATLTRLRRLFAGLGALAGVVPLVAREGDETAAWLPATFLLVAAMVVHLPRLGLQLLARAGWWSNLGLGTILCVVGSDSESVIGASLSVGCGLALLVCGPGLAEASERDRFAPAQSRTALLVLMVLALADAQTFALIGVLESDGSSRAGGPLLLALAAAYLGGFVGMVRLSAWGPLVTTAASVIALVLFVPRLVRVDSDFVPVIAVLAGLQVLAGAAVLLAAARGRPLLPPLPPRVRAMGAASVVLGLVAVALLRLAGVFSRL